MVTYSVEQVIEGFSIPVIRKHKGQPSRQSIQDVVEKLQENAASYPSKLGGGQHGYLGLVMDPEVYETKIGTEFTKYENPRIKATIPEGSTQ